MAQTQRPTRSRKSFPDPEAQDKENEQHRTRAKRAQSMGGAAGIPFKELVLKPAEDGLSPRRRLRRSLVPRKSILKTKNGDDTQDFTMNTQTAPLPSMPTSNSASDFTTAINFTTNMTDDRRKSLARRVSFASHAHVRLFPKDAAKSLDTSPPSVRFAESSPGSPSSTDTDSAASSPQKPSNDEDDPLVSPSVDPNNNGASNALRRRPSVQDAAALLAHGIDNEDEEESSMDVDDDTTNSSQVPFHPENADGFPFPRTSIGNAGGDDMDTTSVFGEAAPSSLPVDDTAEHTASTKSSEGGPAEFLVALGKNVPSSAPNGRPSAPTMRDKAWDALESVVDGVNNESSDDEDMELIEATGRIDAIRRASMATTRSDMEIADATGRILEAAERRASIAQSDMDVDDEDESMTDEEPGADDDHGDKTVDLTAMMARMAQSEQSSMSAQAPPLAPIAESPAEEVAPTPPTPTKFNEIFGSTRQSPFRHSPRKSFTAAFAPPHVSPFKRPASPSLSTPNKRVAIAAAQTATTRTPQAFSPRKIYSPRKSPALGSPMRVRVRPEERAPSPEPELQPDVMPAMTMPAAPMGSQSALQGLEDISGIMQADDDEYEGIEVRTLTINEFLEMTKVTFLDGLAVKRRSTIGPGVLAAFRTQEDEHSSPRPLSDYIAAVAVGIPQLEMYTWACRELKKNIATGQDTVRQFEEQVENSNPILFREYITASEEEQLLMEAQLKLMRIHARLTAKEKWYQWRQGLVQDLHTTVSEHLSKLQIDHEFVKQTDTELQAQLPTLKERHAALTWQLQQERKNILEIEGDNAEHVRELKAGIMEQNAQIDALHAELAEVAGKTDRVNSKLSDIEDQRLQAVAVINKSKQQCSLLGSCTRSEVFRLKEEYESMQRMHLWQPVKISPDETVLTYDSHLQIKVSLDKRTLGLDGCTLVAKDGPQEQTVISILYRIVQHKLKSLPSNDIIEVLRITECMWAGATHIQGEQRILRQNYPVSTAAQTSGKSPSLALTVHIPLPEHKSKINLTFAIGVNVLSRWPASASAVTCSAEVVYGDVALDGFLQAARTRISQADERECRGFLVDACREAVLAALEQ